MAIPKPGRKTSHNKLIVTIVTVIVTVETVIVTVYILTAHQSDSRINSGPGLKNRRKRIEPHDLLHFGDDVTDFTTSGRLSTRDHMGEGAGGFSPLLHFGQLTL